jgi:hypothetical protein
MANGNTWMDEQNEQMAALEDAVDFERWKHAVCVQHRETPSHPNKCEPIVDQDYRY